MFLDPSGQRMPIATVPKQGDNASAELLLLLTYYFIYI